MAQVRDALSANDAAGARALAVTAIASETNTTTLAELRWLALQASDQLEDEPGALAQLELLASTPSPLQPWAKLRLATRSSDANAERATALAADVADMMWVGRLRARRLHAQLLAQSHPEQATPLLRALVREADANTGAASAGMPLAEILTRAGDEASLVEALSLYRRVASRAPLADVGRRAVELAETTLMRLPASRQQELAQPTAEEQLARANALYGALRNEDAERAYEAAARATTDTTIACEARFMRAKATLRRRDREEGAVRMRAVVESCTGDVQARALYAAAKAHDLLGQDAEAISLYAQLEQVAPTHRLADDAHLLIALARREAGDDAGFVTALAEMPHRYPHGDMTGDALFRLGAYRLAHQDPQGALEAFEALDRAPEDTAEDALGRAGYWRGRALMALGRGADAAEAFTRVATHYPLAYYAQLAMSRLAALDHDAFAHLSASLNAPTSSGMRFPHRVEMDGPAFARLLSLLRVGDLSRATLELEAQGFLGEGSDPDALWLAAALMSRAGDQAGATQLSRRRLRSFRQVTPVGPGRALWRLAYPRAFSPLIEDTATGARVPATLVRAIAREESGFNPDAVSWARAYGLVQVILPTARRFGRPLGLTITARTMRQADTNLKVGTRFMRFLLDRYGDNPALIPAAYNAGHGAADRWLRARGELPLDEWVEAIPYAETRRYTRRVLQSYGVYRYLDTGEVPLLSFTLPPAP